MFTGPLSTFPAAGYLIVERGIFGGDTAVEGASVWVFVLLGVEAIKTYRSDPYFTLSTTKIPTWTTPLILATVIKILVPATSFLGHLCAVSTGYLFGLGYLKFMAPPEKIMRWIEGKLNLLGRLPHYVSIDQKTFGRYGVLPTREAGGMTLRELGGGSGAGDANGNTGSGYIGSTQRLGP
ncbi:MAG: putative rhomboid protease [Cirrosporium novae-zelandiae]|nr:MAG: putative rhomboid protease [Cirrosporium novae-zelandiae]